MKLLSLWSFTKALSWTHLQIVTFKSWYIFPSFSRNMWDTKILYITVLSQTQQSFWCCGTVQEVLTSVPSEVWYEYQIPFLSSFLVMCSQRQQKMAQIHSFFHKCHSSAIYDLRQENKIQVLKYISTALKTSATWLKAEAATKSLCLPISQRHSLLHIPSNCS